MISWEKVKFSALLASSLFVSSLFILCFSCLCLIIFEIWPLDVQGVNCGFFLLAVC